MQISSSRPTYFPFKRYSCNRIVCTSSPHRSSSDLSSPNSNETRRSDCFEVISPFACLGTSVADVRLSILPGFLRTMLHCIQSPLDPTPFPTKTPTLHPPPLPPSPQILGCLSYNQPWSIRTIIFARYRDPSASTLPTLAIFLQVPLLERS